MIVGVVGSLGIADEDLFSIFVFVCGVGAYVSLLVAIFLFFGALFHSTN